MDEQPIRRLNQMKTDITTFIYTDKKMFMEKIITALGLLFLCPTGYQQPEKQKDTL